MEGPADPEVNEPLLKRRRNVTTMLANADRVQSAWVNFLDEFYNSSFDPDEFKQVLTQLESKNLSKETVRKMKDEEEDAHQMSQDMETFDDEVSQLEKKVFGNHLISKAIFSHLSIGELLPCRLVNTCWNETVNEILLGKQLTLKFTSDKCRFYHSRSNWRSLDMLTEFMRSSPNFPCKRFEFSNGNLENDDAHRFFSRFGPMLSYLNIYSSGHSGRISRRRCERCGEYHYDSSDDDEEEEDAPGFRSRATTFNTVGNILMKNTTNIKELVLEMMNGRTFDLNADIKLLHLTNLTFETNTEAGQKMLLCLLNGAENLKTINISDGCSTSVLSQIPPSCQKSLVKMETFQNFEWNPSIKLSVFKNVQHISFKAVKDHGSFLPQDSSVSVDFPRLNTLSIQFLKMSSGSWKNYFPANEAVPTVHTIIINGALFCPSDTEKLLEMFPNLQNLVLFGISNFYVVPFAQAIWKFHKALRILKVGRNFAYPSKFFPVLSPDSDVDKAIKSGDPIYSSCADLEFVWQNFVEVNNHPLFGSLKDEFKYRIQSFAGPDLRIISRTKYRLHDSSTITLTKLMNSRGMTWESAVAKHSLIKHEDEGFYMTTNQIMGVKGKSKGTVVKTIKTVQLLVRRVGTGSTERLYSSFRPYMEETVTSFLPSAQKISDREAKRLWQREYKNKGSPKLQCQHIYIHGKCPDRVRGEVCNLGVRELAYYVLSGPILKAFQTVNEAMSLRPYGNSIDYAKLVRVQDDVDPFMGILIGDSSVENLKQALSSLAESVNEQ